MRTKLNLLVALFLISALTLNAQNDKDEHMQTLFGNGPVAYGGYGGPRVTYSKFDGRDVWMVGGRGGVIFNHVFSIGGAGYGIVNSPFYSSITYKDSTFSDVTLQGGFGGMQLEFFLKPMKVLHISFPVLIGAGDLMLVADRPYAYDSDLEDRIICHGSFFVIEPNIEVELNVIRFMRLSLGVGYRYTPGVDLADIPSNAFNSVEGSISLKFGSF